MVSALIHKVEGALSAKMEINISAERFNSKEPRIPRIPTQEVGGSNPRYAKLSEVR